MEAMSWLTWLNDNWFALVQSGGIVAGLGFTGFALRSNTKALRIQNLFSLTTQHREIWSLVYSHPELSRILESKVDLAQNPVTAEERLFINFLILHLTDSFVAIKTGLFTSPENLAKDIHEFFSLPIPQSVWKTSKTFQDKDFVLFVERSVKDGGQ
jgi:hypothetical protein